MRLFEGTQFDVPPRCDRCEKLESECVCPPVAKSTPRIPAEKQTARIQIEKRKKGKVVTTIRGLDDQELPELLVKLKNSCGAGGTVKDGVIEIQGKHADRAANLLREMKYNIRN